MERGEWREGDHHTQRSSSFLWTNARLTLGCPACLSFSLMCSPRLPGQQLRRHGAPAVAATASRPAAPPCTPRPVFTGATASIFPMALFLGGASHKALLHGVPASNTSATASLPLPPLRPGQQRPASNISAATAPRPAASRWRSATAHGQQHLRNGAPASSTSATVPRPAAPPPLRPGQQQTSPGGEKYSGLASNLAHLGRIC